MRIEGHAALVTGGGSGLGAGTAKALAEAGAKVAVLDIDMDKAEAVADEIGGLAIFCDVADASSAQQAVERARNAHGAARIAVNCAGIAPAARIVGKEGAMPLAEFSKVINVNLVGSFNIMRLSAADMAQLDPLEDGERGIVISTSSVAAYEGQIGQAAYAASKGGISALTLPAARELARHGIRVLAIAPGLFGTPLLLNMPENVQQSLTETLLFPKRFGTPAEFAALAIHMVQNPVLNGEVVRIDNALRMGPR